MFQKLVDKAKALKDKADLSHAMETIKQLASDSLEVGKSKANDFLEQNWPKIEKELLSELLTATEDKLKDDQTLEALLDKSYELFPLPVRLVLPHAKFIAFSMKKREPLLLKLQEHKTKNESIDGVSIRETFDTKNP
jgi:hypothetical protein